MWKEWVFLTLVALCLPAEAEDFWEMEPIRYSDTPATDRISQFSADLTAGKEKLTGESGLQALAHILDLLEISSESQMLVFSQTSQQNAIIRPKNPRSLYFNENSYVGYVPGGDIEIITHDPLLGVVFYLIDLSQKDPAKMVIRDRNSACLSCHGTRHTESVPGMLVRSVHPDENGHLILSLGTDHIDSRSPIPIRWGGYYVTGSSSLPHLGNRIYSEKDQRGDVTSAIQYRNLDTVIDVTKYLRNSSDIVALMVLEHQCRMHNLLIAASLDYRRKYWLSKSLDPNGDPDLGRAGKTADEYASEIVDALFFKDEAAMGDGGVDGNVSYQDAFSKRFPRIENGDSLAEFHLGNRLFKNRCSYMIYSKAFDVLPGRVKHAVFKRLKEVLEHGKEFPQIGTKERRRITEILRQTVKGYQ